MLSVVLLFLCKTPKRKFFLGKVVGSQAIFLGIVQHFVKHFCFGTNQKKTVCIYFRVLEIDFYINSLFENIVEKI